MSNLLFEYIQKGKKEIELGSSQYQARPIVTISREYGCPSAEVAGMLCEKINHELFSKKDQWRWVNKEILEKSSAELNIDQTKVENIFNNEQRTTVEEIIEAFSNKYYKSDRKIKKTIKSVVESIAWQGNVIIVGRGGVAITHDHPNALHVRLIAPIEWRVDMISSKYSLSKQESENRVIESDKNRKAIIEEFLGKPYTNDIFDLIINSKSFSTEATIELIIKMMKTKKLM
ncbi:MAG: cytidylate kinase-like family protein [Paludibacteraceae bacterium]|nr:cytidylate kinase-like family protein [Paludibacteraceae bacterium]